MHLYTSAEATRVDGRALRDALIRSAQRHGARFIQGRPG